MYLESLPVPAGESAALLVRFSIYKSPCELNVDVPTAGAFRIERIDQLPKDERGEWGMRILVYNRTLAAAIFRAEVVLGPNTEELERSASSALEDFNRAKHEALAAEGRAPRGVLFDFSRRPPGSPGKPS